MRIQLFKVLATKPFINSKENLKEQISFIGSKIELKTKHIQKRLQKPSNSSFRIKRFNMDRRRKTHIRSTNHHCLIHRCLHPLLLLILLPDSSREQQQLFFRPADQQWYFQAPGQQAQPLQQQQFQVGGFPQQSTATDSAGGGSAQATAPQFQFVGHSQASNQQQQQSATGQSPIFFQQQFDAPSNPSAQGQQFFPQNQQFQFAGPPPPGPSLPQPQQPQQFPQQFSNQPQFQQFPQSPSQQQQFQPQFQQQPQQFLPQQFPQQQQPSAALNWFVPSSGPGEFQEQLPELIRPPQTLIQRADPQPPQQQQQFIPQQEFSLPQPPPPPPPPPQLFQQPFFIPNNQQPNQTPNQQQIAPPVPPPRIVHIRTQQEFRDILPQLFQMPVLAEQITPSSNRIGTVAPKRPPPPLPSQQRIVQQRKLLTAVTSRRPPPPPPPPTTTTPITTTVTHPPPPPAVPVPAPMLVKEEKEPLEFDLPPPPPARFLPEGEKIRIAEFLRQQQSRTKNKGVHAGLITDFPTLVRSITPPAPITTTQKAPRRSTLARLAAVADQEVGNGIERPECSLAATNVQRNTVNEFGLDLFTCAAQDQDHTECCRQSRVHKTSAADKCLAFCNLAPEAPRIQLDASYLPCWAVLNEVKSCFRENILNKSAATVR